MLFPCRHPAAILPRPCHGFERSLSERHIRGMAGERHGMCESALIFHYSTAARYKLGVAPRANVENHCTRRWGVFKREARGGKYNIARGQIGWRTWNSLSAQSPRDLTLWKEWVGHGDKTMPLTAWIQPRATVAFFRPQEQQQQWKLSSTGKQPILNDMSEKRHK
jgi:hypothetical protein